ncbi:MAG: serine/threonine protein kinase [Fuerstiella sp.]|nr:serine/threonine protein kinase [Fuerstiella sp.]
MYPDHIGPYHIERKIGSGGMGNVYLGTHTQTGHIAAVKVLPASLAREEGFVHRFTREIQALRKLNSAHIVELFDDGSTEDGSWYYAMEFVDGKTLTTLIADRQKLPWTEVSDITLQIAAALKAAHDAGVVHRDIKPSNLMITPDGTVKLTDFGVAHVFATTRLTRTGGVVGTAEYMSPEQARGQRATQRSDLYSLGAVMYAMLTGRPPFNGRNATEILHKQQFSQIEKPRHYVPEIPRLFEELVCQLLEKKPDKRTANALVLSRKLEQIRSRVAFMDQQEIEERQNMADVDVPATKGATSAAADDDDHTMQRPGPATLVRDILRHEVTSQLEKSILSRVFDNTYVLMSLLLLVLGLGYYLWQTTTLTAKQRFENAATVMSGNPTSAWLRERDTLQELLKTNAIPERVKEMTQMVRNANQYEFSRTLERAAPVDGSKDSEIQRMVRRAFDHFARGNVTRANADLNAVASLIENSTQDGFLHTFILETLERWKKDKSVTGRQKFLKETLDEAKLAIGHPERSDTAISLLDSVLQLYEDDDAVAAEIEYCIELKKQIQRGKADQ